MTTDFRQALHELQPNNGDYLRIAGNQQLLEFFNAEKRLLDESPTFVENLYFSDSVYKVNSRGIWQQRHLVVTNTSLMHFLPHRYRKPRRDIAISNICGIIVCDHANEILFKLADKNDLRVRLMRRAECVKVIAMCYKLITNSDLSVVQSDLPNLQTLTSKKRRFLTRNVSNFEFESFSYPPPTKSIHPDSDSSHHHDSYASDDYTHQPPTQKIHEALSSNSYHAYGVFLDDINDRKQLILFEGWLSHKPSNAIFWRPFFYRIVPPNLQYFDISTKGTMTIEEGLVKQFPRIQYDHTLDEFLSDPSKRSLLKGFSRLTNQKESVSFCLDVKAFQEMSHRTPEAFEMAKTITKKYIFPGAGSQVDLWNETKENIVDAITLGQERRQVSPRIFDDALRRVMSDLRTKLLPMIIEELKRNSASNQELFPECRNCLKPFSLTRTRKQCNHCNSILCNYCITQEARFSDAAGNSVTEKVCDMCEFHLSPDARSNFAFSYAAKSRARPLYLSASSPEQMARWVQALNNAAFAASHKLDPPNTRMEGWLKKRNPNASRWRSRYFVLDGFKLWYFQMSYKGSIPVSRDSGAHASLNRSKTLRKEDCAGLSTNSDFSFRFELTDSNHTYYLAADTERSMHTWIKFLREAAKLSEGSALSAGGGGTTSSTSSALSPTFIPSPNGTAPSGEVTCVFTNIQDASILWEKEPDGMNIASYYHDKILRDLLQVYKGYEVKTEGDAFMVTFSSPSAALSWCIAVQNALLFCGWPDSLISCHESAAKEIDKMGRLVFCGLRVQMGVNLGYPICRRNPVTNRMDYFGAVVNRAARIANSAYGGQIICDSSVYNALSSSFSAMFICLGVHRYKGITEPVTIYQVSSFELPNRNFPQLKDESTVTDQQPSARDRDSQLLASPSLSNVALSDLENEDWNSLSNFSHTWPAQT